jgi:hypothetical protein
MMHDMVEPSGSASIALLATAASSGKRAETKHFRAGKEARPQQIAALQRYGQSE